MRRVLHGGVDRLAMWLEDRVPHEAEPFRPAERRALRCFEPLARLPDPPEREGVWSAPSPRAQRPGDRMVLRVTARRAPFRGTAVLVPPWKIASASLLSGYADLLAAQGYDVWLVVPPEHMERAAPGARSGHRFATVDVDRFRALFEQLVVEIRAAVAMGRRRGPVGVVAVSIGALGASFAIAAPEPPDFAALVAPPADLASVLVETPIGARYRRLGLRAGSRWPEAAELREALAPFDPRALAPPRCRLLVAVGRYDRIAFAAGALALARAWDVAPTVYARGHLTLIFLCRSLRRDLARFVAAPAPLAAVPAPLAAAPAPVRARGAAAPPARTS